MYKVVMYNTEGVGTDVEQQVLNDLGVSDQFKLVRIDGDKDDEFFAEARDADGVIIVYTDMNRTNFKKLEKCQVLTIHAIGVNNIDQSAATDLGICVGNVPTYCLEEVAIHTIAMVLDGVRKITQLDRKCWSMARCSGMWKNVQYNGKNLRSSLFWRHCAASISNR